MGSWGVLLRVAGGRVGERGRTFLYRDDGNLGEGLFKGTMNKSWSLALSTGSISGADSLVMELLLGLNSTSMILLNASRGCLWVNNKGNNRAKYLMMF